MSIHLSVAIDIILQIHGVRDDDICQYDDIGNVHLAVFVDITGDTIVVTLHDLAEQFPPVGSGVEFLGTLGHMERGIVDIVAILKLTLVKQV